MEGAHLYYMNINVKSMAFNMSSNRAYIKMPSM